ncbi:MAG: HD domain-containing phosphohydrolase [Pyrinomonadaceae bacterium]
MSANPKKISLLFFVVITLMLVGLVPLLLTGWFLSEKSGRELRSAENRYQIQLVQEKARQIEMFGRRFTSVVSSVATALEISNDPDAVSSLSSQAKLGAILRDNPELLGLYVKTAVGEPISVFRSESLSRVDLEAIAADMVGTNGQTKVIVGEPKRLLNTNVFAMPFAASARVSEAETASVVAVASLETISRSLIGISKSREADLWTAGLPMVFVVNPAGEAMFHPDPELPSVRRPMGDLKIVGEWLESGAQVQSALVPFSATYGGETYEMIGAYSTAELSDGYNVGVIAMQDESRALASVGEMRWQTWLISGAFAIFALIVGLIGARYLTSPLLRLVTAAKLIAAGDFSARVETRNITEIGTLGDTFNLMTDKIEDQIANLAAAAHENRELFVGTVKALAAAIDGKDKYTRGHSERVSRISVAIGRRMGMGEDELETLRMSALLHDIGKIGIDDSILKKPAALTDAEYEIMKTHPQRGYKIMSQIPAMKDFLPGMYMHHEMVNGQGYPQGLTSDQIPLQAKIVSVADTFDAMTIDRPYSKGMDLPSALEKIRELIGTRYQADVVEALVDACDAGEVANGIVRQLAAVRSNTGVPPRIPAKLVA